MFGKWLLNVEEAGSRQEKWRLLMCEKGTLAAMLGFAPALRYPNRVWVCQSVCVWLAAAPADSSVLVLGSADLNMTHNWMQRVQRVLFFFLSLSLRLMTEQAGGPVQGGEESSSLHRHPQRRERVGVLADAADLHLGLLIAYFWVLLLEFCTCLCCQPPYAPPGIWNSCTVSIVNHSDSPRQGSSWQGGQMLYSYHSKCCLNYN